MVQLASNTLSAAAAVNSYFNHRFVQRLILNFSMNWLLGCRLRGALLRFVGVKLPSDGKVSRGTRLGGTNISMGVGFGANEECWIDDHVAIGSRVRIGPRVTIVTQSHPIGCAQQRRGWEDVTRPVKIGDGAWLQTGCMVMPGAHVAAGCVILAGAVVTKSTLPHGEYAGIPAVRTRDLPSDSPIAGRRIARLADHSRQPFGRTPVRARLHRAPTAVR